MERTIIAYVLSLNYRAVLTHCGGGMHAVFRGVRTAVVGVCACQRWAILRHRRVQRAHHRSVSRTTS